MCIYVFLIKKKYFTYCIFSAYVIVLILFHYSRELVETDKNHYGFSILVPERGDNWSKLFPIIKHHRSK
jgi:hypothetical protein